MMMFLVEKYIWLQVSQKKGTFNIMSHLLLGILTKFPDFNELLQLIYLNIIQIIAVMSRCRCRSQAGRKLGGYKERPKSMHCILLKITWTT